MTALRKPSAETAGSEPEDTRGWIARAFTAVEDVVYVGLGALLAAAALALLVDSGVQFIRLLTAGKSLQPSVLELLDRLLLILMIVEVMYTVQVSFREHALVPEPFLIVGLVAVTRRILVITAEFSELTGKAELAFRNAMIELAMLTVMILVLVASIRVLRIRRARATRG